MFQKKCAFCRKDIPSTIVICPYCQRDERGQAAVEEAVILADSQLLEDIKHLGSEDPYVRKGAGERLVQRGSAAVPALTTVVQEHAQKGVAEAARLLGRLRDRRAVAALVQALKIGDEELRTSAVWALTQINDPQALEEILHEASRNNPAVQAYVAYKISAVQDPRVLPTLLKLAQHTNREVSFQAIWALGESGDSKAILPLRKLLGGRDPLLRSAVESALRRLGGPVRRAYSTAMVLGGIGSILAVLVGLGWIFYR